MTKVKNEKQDRWNRGEQKTIGDRKVSGLLGIFKYVKIKDVKFSRTIAEGTELRKTEPGLQ